jgi:hypothetical protein
MMVKPGKASLIRTHSFFLILFFLFFFLFILAPAPAPAQAQRGTLGIDLGETTDKFGSLSSQTAGEVRVEGEFNIIQSGKDGNPNIVIGGEVDAPTDTNNHAKEYAVFGGPIFPIGNFSAGFYAEIRKIVMPAALVDNQNLIRFNMELLEIPVVLKYKFGPDRRAFVQVQGEPEFTPRFRNASASQDGILHPNFNYAYTVRGGLGYNFGKWYVRGTYQLRSFQFTNNPNNPSGLYNWRSNAITGGIGLNF